MGLPLSFIFFNTDLGNLTSHSNSKLLYFPKLHLISLKYGYFFSNDSNLFISKSVVFESSLR